jgi:glucosamine-6-phosphate deaminase
LGGIGPDGHIAFNTRGSDLFSTTRLTETNFETQAVAAGDLGGIEISANRLVITIGLDTIVHNPDAVAIIIAAGEAKAPIVKKSLESDMTNVYPATVLQKLKNGRFYLTKGGASKLEDSVDQFYATGKWTKPKRKGLSWTSAKNFKSTDTGLTIEDLKNDKYTRQIPDLNENTVKAKSLKASMPKLTKDGVKKKMKFFCTPDPTTMIFHWAFCLKSPSSLMKTATGTFCRTDFRLYRCYQ